jgi:DsbC/DsbD-like thiol-disulfide interchange protein
MNRRHLFALPLFAWVPAAQASAPQVNLTLRDGGWDGDARLAGVHLQLVDGWKTYWRMPGEAGVPPEFDWSASTNLARNEVLYPVPRRIVDAGGETVGYKHEVVFPVRIYPSDPAAPVALKLALFAGVCKNVCVPVHVAADARLDGGTGLDEALLRQWLARVPQPAAEPLPISAATLALESGKPSLVVSLSSPAEDIFIEGEGSAYYRKPDFAADGLSARIVIGNVKDGDKLRGTSVLATVSAAGKGLEQKLTLA